MVKMFASERKSKILDYLQKKRRATVKELSEILNVSVATLRTDLNHMEQEGLLLRTHGGATLPDDIQQEYSFSFREKANRSEKMAIGLKASELVADGECILLDASSTALEMARILKKRQIRLTVVTNGVYTAMELSENPGITVILIGGILRIGSIGVEGILGADILKQINIDTIFTSASGYTFQEGLTDFNVYEVELKRAMISSATRVVALIDHSKIGKSSIATFAENNQIEILITDSSTSKTTIDQLRQMNITVIIAE